MRRRSSPVQTSPALLEFLPAALEIERTPPFAGSRAILWTVMGVFSLALAWSCIGQVDVVAVAGGRIVPGGRVKIIQPARAGVVREIHVRDGQSVETGELLIALDPHGARTDLRRTALERRHKVNELENLAWQLDALDRFPNAGDYFSARAENGADFKSAGMTSPLHLRADAVLDDHFAQRAVIEHAIRENQAERHSGRRRLARVNASLPLLAERARAMRQLAGASLASRASWLELEIPRVERAADAAVERARLDVIDAAGARLARRLDQLVAATRSRWLDEHARLMTEISLLELDYERNEHRLRESSLRSPVAGTVFQLAVHTIGGVVSPAERLMTIVPRGDALAVEARIRNRDVGFVHAGLAAVIKIRTFPFTRYGTIAGRVTSVSRDAVDDEALGLVYVAQVSLARSTIFDGERDVALAPGMAVSVEIALGQRRLIEFIAAPLLRYRDEGLRER